MTQSSDEDSGGMARCRSSPPLTKKERLAKGRAKQQLKLEGAHATIASLQSRVAELEAARDRHQHMLSLSLHKPSAQQAAADAVYGACARTGLPSSTAHALATAASGALGNLAAASSYTLVPVALHQPPGLLPADGSHAEAMASATSVLGTHGHSAMGDVPFFDASLNCKSSSLPTQPSQPVIFNIFDEQDSADAAAGNALEHSLVSKELEHSLQPLASQASRPEADLPGQVDSSQEMRKCGDFNSQTLANTVELLSTAKAASDGAQGMQIPSFHLHNSAMVSEKGVGPPLTTPSPCMTGVAGQGHEVDRVIATSLSEDFGVSINSSIEKFEATYSEQPDEQCGHVATANKHNEPLQGDGMYGSVSVANATAVSDTLTFASEDGHAFDVNAVKSTHVAPGGEAVASPAPAYTLTPGGDGHASSVLSDANAEQQSAASLNDFKSQHLGTSVSTDMSGRKAHALTFSSEDGHASLSDVNAVAVDTADSSVAPGKSTHAAPAVMSSLPDAAGGLEQVSALLAQLQARVGDRDQSLVRLMQQAQANLHLRMAGSGTEASDQIDNVKDHGTSDVEHVSPM